MIEHELSPVPACQDDKNRRKQRHSNTDREHDLAAEGQPYSPVHPRKRNQHYGSDGMIPARGPLADTFDSEQFDRAGYARKNTETESKPGRPQTDTHPECVGAIPIKKVCAESGNDKSDRKGHRHRVNGMSGNRNGRTGIQPLDPLHAKIFHCEILPNDGTITQSRYAGFNLGILVLVLLCSGCAGPLSTLEPAGPASESIAELWWVMLAGATLLFLLVSGILGLGFLRPEAGKNISPRFWLIGGGLLLPVIVLIPLMAYAILSGERLLAHPNARNVVTIKVVAGLSGWRFNYADHAGDAETSDLLYLPVGRPVDLVVTSSDVIHSFWIPRLGGKIDAIPGHQNKIRLSASQPGIYRGVCAEFCGPPHTTMNFIAEAIEFDAFETRMRNLAGEAK